MFQHWGLSTLGISSVVSFQWLSPRSVWLSLLYSPPIRYLHVFSSAGVTVPYLSLFSCVGGFDHSVIFVALCWTQSDVPVSFLCCASQMAMFFLTAPDAIGCLCHEGALLAHGELTVHPDQQVPFLQSWFPAGHYTACAGAWGSSSSGAGFCSFLC